MILVCEICDEKLATFDPDAISSPIDGWMFQPLAHGYPQLWPEGMGWEHMRCPMCRFRPVVDEVRLLTPDGYHEIGAEVDIHPMENPMDTPMEKSPDTEVEQGIPPMENPMDNRLALIAAKAKEKQRGKRRKNK